MKREFGLVRAALAAALLFVGACGSASAQTVNPAFDIRWPADCSLANYVWSQQLQTCIPLSASSFTLTTTGSSGAATFVGGVLNIPVYSGGSSGFPIVLGSTSIAASSTTTSLAGLTVNGVTLNATGSASLFLNQAGGYSTPSGSSGTVTSVAQSVPSALLSIAGTPITGAGTLAIGLTNAAQNSVWAGPATGGAGAPSYQTAPTIAVTNMTGTGAFSTTGSAGSLGGKFYTSTWYNFSDSIGAGVGASAYQFAYAGILQAAHAGPTVNQSFGGQDSASMVRTIASIFAIDPTVTVGLPITTLPIGINNYNGCGATTACQDIYTRSMGYAVSWTGMTPAQGNRVLAAAMTVDGTFSTDTTDYALPVVVSTTNGGVASWSITSTGNPIGIDYIITPTNGGTMGCKVDSGSATTINLTTIGGALFTGAYSIFRTELAASAGTHTITCIVTSSTSASNRVALLASDVFPTASAASLPAVVMTNVEGISGSNNSAAITFNALAATVEGVYAAEGANIVLADINTASNSYGSAGYSGSNANCPTNADATNFGAGGLHPNNCPHDAIAKAIIAAAPAAFILNAGQPSAPLTLNGIPVPNTSYYWTGNANAQFSPTNLNPGGLCVYPGFFCEDLGAFTGTRPEQQTVGNPYFRIYEGMCFAEAHNALPSLQSQFEPYVCDVAHNWFFWTSDNALPSGNIDAAIVHPWIVSRDNQFALTNASPANLPAQSDILYVGTLTGTLSQTLTPCDTSLVTGYSFNPRYEFYRIGSDGNSVVFTDSGGATINGSTTYTWTAAAGGKLELQCSNTAVGGSYWIATPLSNGSGGSMTWPTTPGITVCTGTPCTAWGTSLAAPASAIVGISDTQTLTNKSIAGSEVNSGTISSAHGGLGIDTSGLTGYPSDAAGTWSVATASATFSTLYKTVATSLGDIIGGGASGVPTRLAGPTTNGLYALTEQPVSSAAVAPVFTLLAASATTDTTNASNIGTGTLGAARLPVLNSSGAGQLVGPGFPSAFGITVNTTTAAPVANRVYVDQFTLTSATTVGHAGVTVVTASSGQSLNIGIYDSGGNRLVDSGSISTTTTGSISNVVSPAVTLQPGVYFLAVAMSDTVAVIDVMVGLNTANVGLINKNSTKLGWGTNPLSGGVLPSTLGTLTAATGASGGTSAIVPFSIFEF